MQPDERPEISAEDIETRTLRRRTFLGRFGAAAGLAGLVGWTSACGGSDSADTDSGDPADSD